MNLRFFLRENEDIEVRPQKSGINTSEHYAWCLQQVNNEFHNANTGIEIRLAMEKFKENMLSSDATIPLFKDIEAVFNTILYDNPLPDKEYLFSFMSSILDVNNGYINVHAYPKSVPN